MNREAPRAIITSCPYSETSTNKALCIPSSSATPLHILLSGNPTLLTIGRNFTVKSAAVDRLKVNVARQNRSKQDHSNDCQLGKIESTQRVEWDLGGPDGKVEGSADAAKGLGAGSSRLVMPGVLKKSQDDLRPLKPGKRGPVEEMAEQPSKKAKREIVTNGVQIVNGNHVLLNGPEKNGVLPGQPDVQTSSVKGLESLFDGRLPPEISAMNASFDHVSVSSLMTRLAQETFNQLKEMVDDMFELEVAPINGLPVNERPHAQINGGSAISVSQANVNKKQRLLEFAYERRTQFIKMLVLLQWSRQAEEMTKIIDLGIWLKWRRYHFGECVGWLKKLKTNLDPFKVPNPDLKTALQALSLGKASWLADLGYLPLEKLPPRELLKALRRINTLLSIRLNIHEAIPPPFRDFRVASGRATFQVKDEFEVDLSIADEDPKSQFYFLDFRFLFFPTTSGLPQGSLRSHVEGKLNEILGRDGLSGCYKFLHDFVLTYKLNLLSNQAYEMLRGHWSDQMKVENIHRSLVVQYWLQRPGNKNWIEIGVKRGKGKQRNGLDPSYPTSEIALRWFQAGKEMKDVKIEMGLDNLSFSGILRRVIAMHTTYILKETASRLRGGALYSERLLKLKQSCSATEPTNISLLIQLTGSKAIKLVQEPITGQFAILPASPSNSSAERELNSLASPAEDASARIANLRCATAREELEVCARSASWEIVRSLSLDRETMQRFFPKDTLRISFLRRRSWKPNWNIAISTSLMGDAVWVVESGERKSLEQGTKATIASGLTIRLAFKVPRPGLRSTLFEPTISNLQQVESAAVGMIAQHLNTQQLLHKGIPYKLQPGGSASEARLPSLRMKFPVQRASKMHSSLSAMPPQWRNDIITLEFGGVHRVTSSGKHVVKARLRKAIPNIKALTSTLSSSITFHPSTSEFAFRLNAPVGTPTIPNLIHRLSTIERLLRFLAIIQHNKLSCTVLSLTRLTFVYATEPATKATINFPAAGPMQITFDQSSPLLRIQDALTEILRSPAGGLTEVLAHIKTTLPLCRGLSNLEKSWANLNARVDILPRSAECFILRYLNPHGKVEINLNDRRGNIMWIFNERGAQKDESRDEGLEKGLKELARGKGEGWRGLNGAMVATPKAAEDFVTKIDEIFRDARKDPPVLNQGVNTSTQELTNGTTQKSERPQPAAPNPRKRKAETTEDDLVVLDW